LEVATAWHRVEGDGAGSRSGRRHRRRRGDQFRQFAEVLSGRSEEELVVFPGRSAQSQAIEAQDALQVGEQHLDLQPLAEHRIIDQRCRRAARAWYPGLVPSFAVQTKNMEYSGCGSS
jgi:hypothetical protein